jgi:hypothetical protein
MDHSDFYNFATHFWWLIFPVGWGIAGLLGAWMKHKRAEQALDILTTYASQNKEPPPEVLALLQPRERREERRLRLGPLPFLTGGFFFTAMTVAFAVLYLAKRGDGGHDDIAGLMFTTVLMAGFAVALFLTGWIVSRSKNQIPPQ